jgi:hypothetical protein
MGELNKKNIKELPIEKYTVTYKHFFTDVGKHIFVIVGEIKDFNNNLVKYDSTTTTLNVIN